MRSMGMRIMGMRSMGMRSMVVVIGGARATVIGSTLAATRVVAAAPLAAIAIPSTESGVAIRVAGWATANLSAVVAGLAQCANDEL